MCSQQTCPMVHVPVFILRMGNRCHACSIFCPHHDTHCKMHRPPVGKISTLYFCRRSGNVHWCSAKCIKETNCDVDAAEICRVSGLVYAQQHVSCFGAHAARRRTRHIYRDPYSKHRAQNTRLSMTMRHGQSAYRCQTLNIIRTLLFSKRRRRAEVRKKHALVSEARKRVYAYYKLCKRHRRRIVYTDMICIYMHAFKTKHIFRGLFPSKTQQSTLENRYMERCVKMWNILKNMTSFHQEKMDMSFHVFVASFLYIMKKGLPMNCVQIIPKDLYLETALPEANTLDTYGVDKRQFTTIKNNIQKSIREAIASKTVNPHQLSVC